MYCCLLLLFCNREWFLTKALNSSNTYSTVNFLFDFSYLFESNMVKYTKSGRYNLSIVHWIWSNLLPMCAIKSSLTMVEKNVERLFISQKYLNLGITLFENPIFWIYTNSCRYNPNYSSEFDSKQQLSHIHFDYHYKSLCQQTWSLKIEKPRSGSWYITESTIFNG